MLRLLSRSRFIISLRFSGLLMYFVMMVKLCRSSSSSPSSWAEQQGGATVKRNSTPVVKRDSYLEGLAFGDVVFRVQQLLVFAEELEERKRGESSGGSPPGGRLVSKHADGKMRSSAGD